MISMRRGLLSILRGSQIYTRLKYVRYIYTIRPTIRGDNGTLPRVSDRCSRGVLTALEIGDIRRHQTANNTTE